MLVSVEHQNEVELSRLAPVSDGETVLGIITARVSCLKKDDLVIGNRWEGIRTLLSAASLPTTAAELRGAPMATSTLFPSTASVVDVVAMRLNPDALHDLVVLHGDGSLSLVMSQSSRSIRPCDISTQ